MASQLRRTRSVFQSRRSRPTDTAFDVETSPEDFAWKAKYRQSLNDIDLATRFAEYMSPDVSKSFLDHNKAEFENVLETQPRRLTMYSSSPTIAEEPRWQDYDISHIRTNSSPRRSELLVKTSSKDSLSRRQRLLRPMKSFMKLVRRPSARHD